MLSKSTLKRKQEFDRVKCLGRGYQGSFMRIKILLRPAPSVRLGIAASKRYGIAAQRNRFKRQVREAFRALVTQESFDIIVYPKPSAKEAKTGDIAIELKTLIDQGHASQSRAEKSGPYN